MIISAIYLNCSSLNPQLLPLYCLTCSTIISNITLNRLYNDYLERFCNTCHREKKDVECTNCKLQQDEYRKGFLKTVSIIPSSFNKKAKQSLLEIFLSHSGLRL